MPETRRVVWAPKALQDLRSVWRYYARVASPDIADSLLREIAQTAERLSAQSLRGRARDELNPGLRSVLAHPYTIFYRVRNGTVEIVRVLHERRNFPAFFSKGE
ncbi:MAG TPA: type II toxin-antitoxin system RelE/ParE family toxin [Microvirga sp.]|nr:type II toxin-antitoxin system RelE/ParE family toxin [Microvirga sp.]